MSSDEMGDAYCIHCGEVISADTEFCPKCGEEQTIDGSSADESTESDAGFTGWAIGFEPGSTLQNALIGLAYFFFYPIGIPLLLYGYARRGGTYKKRVYALLGVCVVVFVVGILALTAIGAMVGPVEDPDDSDGSSTSETTEVPSTPTPEPAPEYAVRIVYDGSWQGALSVTGGGSSQSESVSGTGSETIEITGAVNIVSVNAQKEDTSASELTVQILHEGEVVSEASTSAEYGVAQTTHSF